jgi:hypothetical protein
MLTDLSPKSPRYTCDKCLIITDNKKDFKKHLATSKHQKLSSVNISLTETPQSLTETPQILTENMSFQCKQCSKQYKSRVGLWYHNKKCTTIKQESTQPIEDNCDSDNEEQSEEHVSKQPPTNNEIIEILKIQMVENQELRNFMLEQQKQMIDQILEQQKQMMELATKTNVNNTINSNTNTNCNNTNTFNLQLFLNEKCKDALNLSEFVDTIKVQLSDLENFAHLDYANGVSKILVKNFNNLDTYLRPIHCSDLKRETIYIKENDCWTKEPDDKPSLKKAIKQVAFKNIKQISEWIKENPGCTDPRTKQNVKYNKIVMNSMSGGTVEEQRDNIEQIVKNVTKAVVIDKSSLK